MRAFLDEFDAAFQSLSDSSRRLLELLPADDLYRRPRELSRSFEMFSCGEFILRSAAAVEQSFGGITTRLWDDPFEWTLPESLHTAKMVESYIGEVDETRRSGLKYFASDSDLTRSMPAPVELKSAFRILVETLAKAEHFNGRAFAVFRMLSDEKLPPI